MNIQRHSINSIINTTIELLKDSFFTRHSSFPSKCLFNGHRILGIARIANHHSLIQSNEIIAPNSRLINLSSRDYCTRSRVQISSQSTSTTTIFLTSSIDILSYINKALAELDKFLIDILNGIYHFLIVRIVLDIISSIKALLHTSSKSNQVGRLAKVFARKSYIAIFRILTGTIPFKAIILLLKELSSINLLLIIKTIIDIGKIMLRRVFDIFNLLNSLIDLLFSSSTEFGLILPDTNQSRIDIICKRYKILYSSCITKTKINIREDKSIYFYISSSSNLFKGIKRHASTFLKSSDASMILTPVRIHNRMTAAFDITTKLDIISRSNLLITIHYLIGNRISAFLFLLLSSPICSSSSFTILTLKPARRR